MGGNAFAQANNLDSNSGLVLPRQMSGTSQSFFADASLSDATWACTAFSCLLALHIFVLLGLPVGAGSAFAFAGVPAFGAVVFGIADPFFDGWCRKKQLS